MRALPLDAEGGWGYRVKRKPRAVHHAVTVHRERTNQLLKGHEMFTPDRDQCIEMAAHALDASNRRMDEMTKAPDHSRSGAFGETGQSADALAS